MSVKRWTGDGAQKGDIPNSPSDVIDMLQDRIRVHADWVDWLNENPENGKGHESAGSIEHHMEVVNQYEAAISILEVLQAKVNDQADDLIAAAEAQRLGLIERDQLRADNEMLRETGHWKWQCRAR